jgi:peptidoglycan hydrolase-like protein with peptidoglycan-binding domain
MKRAGIYSGEATGAFDEATETAVVGFQRSRRLDPDCRVGRLTRIALYGAVGGYKAPRLASGASGQATAPSAKGAS